MLNTYAISIYLVKIKGQRKRYAWNVDHLGHLALDPPLFVECGDSFYIFNARRAAIRAAKRHAAGNTTVTEVHYDEVTF